MRQTLIQPFAAIRPAAGRAQDIVARPYDVLSFAEAQDGAEGRPWSFLHVSRAEIDLPAGTDAHSEAVYAQAAKAFAAMQGDGVLVRDPAPRYYVYRMTMDGHVQTGLAAAARPRPMRRTGSAATSTPDRTRNSTGRARSRPSAPIPGRC